MKKKVNLFGIIKEKKIIRKLEKFTINLEETKIISIMKIKRLKLNKQKYY